MYIYTYICVCIYIYPRDPEDLVQPGMLRLLLLQYSRAWSGVIQKSMCRETSPLLNRCTFL